MHGPVHEDERGHPASLRVSCRGHAWAPSTTGSRTGGRGGRAVRQPVVAVARLARSRRPDVPRGAQRDLRHRRPAVALRDLVPRRGPGGRVRPDPRPRRVRAEGPAGVAGVRAGHDVVVRRLDRVEHRLRQPGVAAVPDVRRHPLAAVVPADVRRHRQPDPDPGPQLRAPSLDGRDRGGSRRPRRRLRVHRPAGGRAVAPGRTGDRRRLQLPGARRRPDRRRPRRLRPCGLATGPDVAAHRPRHADGDDRRRDVRGPRGAGRRRTTTTTTSSGPSARSSSPMPRGSASRPTGGKSSG